MAQEERYFSNEQFDVAALGNPNGNMQFTSLFNESFQDGITAHAGGTQALAVPLTAHTCRISTVATAGDSVKLPPSAPGLELVIINHGAQAMQVFGSGTETIDDV